MNGRLENKLKIERRIQIMLSGMPYEVTEFYYNISTHTEATTCLEYIKKIKRFLLYLYAETGQIDFSSVTDTTITKFLKTIEIKEENGKVRSTSFSTWKQFRAALNTFFQYLYEKNKISNNPVVLVKPPKQKDNVKRKFLSEKDLYLTLRAVEWGAGNELCVNRQNEWKDRDRAILLMFITTGMRESALCDMNVSDLDFQNNELIVIDKGYKKNTYTMTPELKKALFLWLKKRNDLLGDQKDIDALFISNRRTRMTTRAVSYLVNKYTKEGIGQEVSPHRLRAAYGNILLKKTNGDLHFVKNAMKHENIATTEIYMENKEKETNDRAAKLISMSVTKLDSWE